MIWTLLKCVVQGLMVARVDAACSATAREGDVAEGGAKYYGKASDSNVEVLTRSIFGRRVYAIGNCERAAYLSGVDTRRVTLACFAISGACAAFSGVLLAGYSTHAYQAMGDPYDRGEEGSMTPAHTGKVLEGRP